MKAMTAQGVIASDGKLRLEIPTDLPPGPAEVVVVIQPNTRAREAPPSLSGALVGKMPPDIDILKEVRAIRRRATKEETDQL